ncbi:MAG: hypothetical protein NT066_06755 [Candidatus Omnitrophica bacterium]|nr:hypothetical protein [Candidatus Omnitrophota bacterium]
MNSDLNLNDTEIKEYFAKAIENEILKLGGDCLGKWYSPSQIKEHICRPIFVYYIDPTKANKDKIVTMGASLIDKNEDKCVAYITVLIKLNDTFASEITKEIHKARLKK